jgi:C1A family cysteine protease
MIERNIGGFITHSEAIKSGDYALTQEEFDQVYAMDHPEVESRMKIVKASVLPAGYSLLPYAANVRDDQGNLGLCFAFAGAGILEYFLKNNLPLGVWNELSELFLGYYSRYICEGGTPSGDNGSTILATAQAMAQYGICFASTWPYVESKENTRPPTSAVNEAKKFEVGKYFAIPNNNNKLTAIKQSIYAGVPIMYGSDVHESIMNVDSTGIEPYASPDSTTDPVAGGHARWVLGWDDTKSIKGTITKGAFLVMNSWSSSWGANGTSWVSYQTWLDQETDDMGITNMVAPIPVPNPTPVPTPTPAPTPVPTPTPSPVPPIDPCPATMASAKKIVYSTDLNSVKVSKLKKLLPK